MSVKEINIIQSFEYFDSMRSIEPSPDWNESLMQRLEAEGRKAPGEKLSNAYTLILSLFVLVNIAFLLQVIIGSSSDSMSRSQELQMVSKEILINPASLNN